MSTSTPALTPELEERIRKNRERALQIQAERKRKLEEEQGNANDENAKLEKKGRTAEEVGCEDWEVGLSEWVSKKEAVAKYCLPEGTLAVCEVLTKENPHRKGWAPMKLYKRSELRERAYKRFGGKEGLIEERTKREQKRLSKDLKVADNLFKS
jgi:DNA-repair protein complementing XP-A cells